MIFIYYLFLFIIGSAIGSFLGVVVDRTISKESIWKGRSHCDHCRHLLHPWDLIPIFSFLLLGGKCRYCHKKLSWFYPIIEFCTGILFVLISYEMYGISLSFLLQPAYLFLLFYYFILSGAFIVIFFTDLRYGIIPFTVVVVALLVTILWYVIYPLLSFTSAEMLNMGFQTNILVALLSALGAGGFFLLIFLLTKGRGMGFGDVVYAFLMGFSLGFPKVLLGLYIAFVTGAIISLLLIAMKKKKFRGGTIPFGPFLVFGTLVSIFWGNMIINALLEYLIK